MSQSFAPFSGSAASTVVTPGGKRTILSSNKVGVEQVEDSDDSGKHNGDVDVSMDKTQMVQPGEPTPTGSGPTNSSSSHDEKPGTLDKDDSDSIMAKVGRMMKKTSSRLSVSKRRMSNASASASGKEGDGKLKRQRNRPFLTSSQLTDLFNRLDRNGDGSLDLDEFTDIIQMLKLHVSEDYIAKIFRNFNTDALTMQEFICAYQKIYSNQITDVATTGSNEEEFIRATRYGLDEDGERLFEMYLIEKKKMPGTVASSSGPHVSAGATNGGRGSNSGVKVNASRKIKFYFQDENEGLSSVEELFKNAKEESWEGSLEDINTMINKDAKANGESGCKLLWWVDIAMMVVERSSMHKYVDAFGIPNNSKFLSTFGNFGSALGKDPKSRIFVGNGVTVDGLITSMNMFIQTAALKDRPVVHHFPAWIENKFQNIESKAFHYVKDYYMSRFAFVFNMSSLSNTNKHETFVSYESAEQLAQRLREDAFDFTGDLDGEVSESESDNDEKDKSSDDKNKVAAAATKFSRKLSGVDSKDVKLHTIMTSKGEGVPLAKRVRHATAPTWIRSNTQLMKHRPSLKLDTLSMHVMDHGGGPNCLITIRAIDDEKQSSKFSLEEKSRCGVLGRILDSIWTKLLVINSADGAADIAGELDESPMTLLSFITMMMHSFSMQSLGSMDYWLNVVEEEIKDMAVSKHSSHLAEMGRITKDFRDYIEPTLTLLSEFLTEWEKETEVFMKAAAGAGGGGGEEDGFDSFNIGPGGKGGPPPVSHVGGGGGGAMRGSIMAPIGGGGPPAAGDRTAMRRASRQVVMPNISETLSVGSNANSLLELEKLPLSYKLVKKFLGEASYRDLKIMLEGYELLEMKGMYYWKEKIEKYDQRLIELKNLIATQLDEKRNFTSFLLTIVTTLLAPLTILTGYFGMNFDNMFELFTQDANGALYPHFPGVRLMWAISGLLYGCMFIFAMHFRVIYSAT